MVNIERTVILHMSDMHFGIPEKRQTASARKDMQEAFVECFSKLIKSQPNWAPDILVLSGDIAWNGSITDFSIAEEFFEKFFSIEGNSVSPSQVVVCFGNHDVFADCMAPVPGNNTLAYDNTLKDFVSRPTLGMNVSPEEQSLHDQFALLDSDIERYSHRFKNAEDFCDHMGFVKLKNSSKVYKYAYGSCRVKGVDFICLNTEWDFWGRKDKEAKGLLRLGLNTYRAANDKFQYFFQPFTYGTPPRFVVFHRSLDHLHEMEQFSVEPFEFDKRIGNLIHQNDVSLNGHEHVHHVEKFGAHTRVLAGTIHSTDTYEFSCNLISIPKELKPGFNECEVRKFFYCPSNPYDHWLIEKGNKTENFSIVRLRDHQRVSEFLNAAVMPRKSENVDMIRNLYPLLTAEETSVLITLLSGGVFQEILEFVKSSNQTISEVISHPQENLAIEGKMLSSAAEQSLDEGRPDNASRKDQGVTKKLILTDAYSQIPELSSGVVPYGSSTVLNKSDEKQ